jgi:DNA-binding transcriptional LysR family regulator
VRPRLVRVLEVAAGDALDERRGSEQDRGGRALLYVLPRHVGALRVERRRAVADVADVSTEPRACDAARVESVDIVGGGFDAGIRISESIQLDLVTVRLSPPFRFVVVGAPSYFAEHRRPQRPRDLLDHDCITFRQPTTRAPYVWEFERRGREDKVAVTGRLLCNDGDLIRSAASKGLGLAYLPEPMVAKEIARRELERVLDDYAPVEPGFFLYFPRRTGMQPKLRAFH